MTIFSEIKLPTVLYEVESKINGKVSVQESGHTRKLVANGVVQSVNPDSPLAAKMCWGRIIDVIAENYGPVNRVLILGLGGATVAHLLSRKFPGVAIVSVELDPTIVDLARKYFDLESIPNHRVVVDDALRVITSPEEFGFSPNEFDCVIVNIFLGENYPDLGNSGNFFSGIKRLLIPQGFAVFNRIYLKHHQLDVNNFIENISDYFNDVKSLIVAGKTNSDNVLIYCFS